MQTGSIILTDNGENLARPAIKLQDLTDGYVLICAFLSGGPTMIHAVQGNTPAFMVFVLDT